MTPNLNRVARSWGAHPPQWVIALARSCDATSQGQAAKRLGMSAAVVNQVLGNAYKGRLDRVEQRVRGELMREKIDCPVLGEISRRDCIDNQARRTFRATNPLRVRLFQACPECPHREASCSTTSS